MKLIASVVLIAGLTLSSVGAQAGGGRMTGGATEFTQIMNNVELLQIGIEEKLQTIEQIEQTYLGRLQQLRSSIGEYTAPFQRAYQSYQKIANLQNKMKSMQGKVEYMNENLNERFLEFSASNLTWNDWMQREARAVSYGDARARAKVETNRRAIEDAKESMDAYQKAAQGMEDTPGVHQAVRQLAPMLQTLGADMNRLIAVTAQGNLVAGEEKVEADARKKGENEKLNKYMDEVRAEREKRRRMLGMPQM